MSNYENLEDEIVDELTEVKASLGDPSEVADPVDKGDNKKKVAMKGSAKAANLKGVEDKEDSSSLNLPVKESKFGMLNAMISEMQKMSSEEVAEIYAAFAQDLEEVSEDIDTDSEEKVEVYRFNVEEEIASVFNGEELSEEFKEKATTIFEAVVSARVNEEVEKFVSAAVKDLEEEKETLIVSMEEKVNTYLDYVVGEWMQENTLAIEQGIKSDIVEDFMTSMKDIFVEHYIEVPDEKVDVVEQLIAKVSELEESLNIVMQENVEMNELVSESAKTYAFNEVAEGMIATDVQKFIKFADSVDASDADDYIEKLKIIKEHYFGTGKSKSTTVVLNEDAEPYVELDEEATTIAPEMQSYAAAISRTAKK